MCNMEQKCHLMYTAAYTNAQAPKWCLEIDKFDI